MTVLMVKRLIVSGGVCAHTHLHISDFKKPSMSLFSNFCKAAALAVQEVSGFLNHFCAKSQYDCM